MLEAIYADGEGFNPRLHFSQSDITVPITFNQDISLPLIALQGEVITLRVDAIPFESGHKSCMLPSLTFRMTALANDLRIHTVHSPTRWKDYTVTNGRLRKASDL